MAIRRTKIITQDVTNATTSLADVTDLSFSANSGTKYWFKFSIMWTANATTTGSSFAINGSGTPTFLTGRITNMTTATVITQTVLSAYNTSPTVGTASAAGANFAYIEGFVTPNTTGAIIARFLSEVAVAGGVVVRAGSKVEWHEA